MKPSIHESKNPPSIRHPSPHRAETLWPASTSIAKPIRRPYFYVRQPLSNRPCHTETKNHETILPCLPLCDSSRLCGLLPRESNDRLFVPCDLPPPVRVPCVPCVPWVPYVPSVPCTAIRPNHSFCRRFFVRAQKSSSVFSCHSFLRLLRLFAAIPSLVAALPRCVPFRPLHR